MAEYIDREQLMMHLADMQFTVAPNDTMPDNEIRDAGIRWHMLENAFDAVKEAPAVDVRPVVLCRDCKWCYAGYCEKYDDLIPFGCVDKPWEDWSCADGEKREES